MKTKFPKLFGVALTLVLVASLFLAMPVLAQDPPTTVDVTWDGGGVVDVDVNTGDALAGVLTYGDYIRGSYNAVDSNNNPYNYGVDNFSAVLDAYVTNGVINAGCLRDDSYVPMYGPDGQLSWSFVGVEGGTAAMAYRTTTNYAQMTDGSYGYQLPGGHNIVVTGATSYLIDRGIEDGRGNEGWVFATGDGSATLDCMVSGASGVWSLTLGRGGGCYTDANFSAIGTSGYFEAVGTGNNSVTFNGMGVSSGGGTLSFIANWLGNFNIGDYSLTTN